MRETYTDEGDGAAVDRRAFIRGALVAALGLPAASALLAGCSSDSTDELLAAFAAVLTQQQTTVNATGNTAVSTLAPSQAQINLWLDRCNQSGATVQAAARSASSDELRAAVPAAMQPVLANLDGLEVPLDPSGPAPQPTQAQLLAAVARANSLLLGHTAADRRALWALCVGIGIVLPQAADAAILTMAGNARDMDTEDHGGRVYDIVFPTPAASTEGYDPSAYNTLLALLLVLTVFMLMAVACEASRTPFLFFNNMLALVVLFALMFYMAGDGL